MGGLGARLAGGDLERCDEDEEEDDVDDEVMEFGGCDECSDDRYGVECRPDVLVEVGGTEVTDGDE